MTKDIYTNVLVDSGQICFSGYDSNGNRRRYKTHYSPVFYQQTTEPSSKKSIEGHSLSEITYRSVSEARQASYQNSSNLYGLKNIALQYILDECPYDGTTHIIPHIGIIDIEVYSPSEFPEPQFAKYPINAITIYSNKHDKYYVLGLDCKWDKSNSELDTSILAKIEYHSYSSEKDLITAFYSLWRKLDLDVISGWNSKEFDIPYIYNRVTNVFGINVADKLSPWDKCKKTKGKDKYGNPIDLVNILGISQLDYLELYQKHTFDTHADFKLNTIAYDELKEEKISYEEADGLHGLYDVNRQKFIDYNIKDVFLVKRIDDNNDLFSVAVDIAYFSNVNYEDTYSPVRVWDNIIYHYLHKLNIIPKFMQPKEKEAFPGAYVKKPISTSRLFKWTILFDLASLYPNIIRQWNIGPETYAGKISTEIITTDDKIEEIFLHNSQPMNMAKLQEYLKTNNYSLAANGTLYRNDKKSFLSSLMEWLYNLRVEAKKEKLKYQALAVETTDKTLKAKYDKLAVKAHVRQLALKILLNSAYGALGNRYFRYYDIKLASAITMSGRLGIKWVETFINRKLSELLGEKEVVDRTIAIDTDSVVGDSKITVNGKVITIAEFFDSIPDDNLIRNDDYNQDCVKSVIDKNITPSINKSGNLEHNQIKYAMKHTVKKKMYRIRTKLGEFVDVTADHSIIVKVKNTGEIKSIKPAELDSQMHNIIINTSEIIFSDDFEVEYLGEYEETVYDIEVEHNHNFFANNICVHNSVYLDFGDIVNKFCPETEEDKIVDWLIEFCNDFESTAIKTAYDNLAEFMNCKESHMTMDREAIASSGFWRSKKNYALRVLDVEGVRKTVNKVMGIETRRGGTPEVVKNELENLIDSLLTEKDNEVIIDEIVEFERKYVSGEIVSVEDIAVSKKCNDINKWDDGKGGWKLGAPGHVRGAIVYNNLIKKYNLTHKYELIKNGDYIKVIGLVPANPYGCNLIAFKDFIPREIPEFTAFLDIQSQFDSTFFNPAKTLCDCVGYNSEYNDSLF